MQTQATTELKAIETGININGILPNKNKQLYTDLEGVKYARLPIKTRILTPNDNLEQIFEQYCLPVAQKGDIFLISEKVVALMQGDFYTMEQAKPGFWAKFLVKFVKKWPNDHGFAVAEKMQVAILEQGLPRILLAAGLSAITKPFGIKGVFYRVAGGNISQIDGFGPGTFPPFDKLGVLAPKNPNQACKKIEQKFGFPVLIVDGNNIGVEVLGRGDLCPLTNQQIRKLIADNPQGQGKEGTPIIVLRKVN
jgi:hypothetical protein